MADEVSDTRDKRSGVIIRATITAEGRSVERRVRNLSQRGACVNNSGDLATGTVVSVSMGALHDLRATVMWVRPTLAGLRFDRIVDLDDARRPRAAAASPQAGWMADINHAYRRRG